MQQFVRVQQGDAVIPGLVSEAGLLDLRSIVSDITPETIASGILTEVNAAPLKPLAGEVRYSHQFPAYARFRQPGSTTRSTSRK
jgi:2,4-didehydro-3-deoxy-L-rhamnonate hydrolase